MRRCAYLTFQPAENDENTWSGLNFHIRQAVRLAGFDVVHLGGLYAEVNFYESLKCRFYRQVIRKGFDLRRNRRFLKKCAASTKSRLAQSGSFDFIIAPSSYPVAFLGNEIPKVVWLDSTFPGLVNYYPGFCNLSQETLREGESVEAEALHNCTAVIFTSDWAKGIAIDRYGLEPRKVHVVPFGANIDDSHIRPEKIFQAVATRKMPPYRFLFLGMDWMRKGGKFAVETIRRLNDLGVPAHLIVVGCQPQNADVDSELVTVEGFLDKTNRVSRDRLYEVLTNSHFLILPTRAEAYGLVFAETAAFGVPSLAIRTGGIPTLIQHGKTGLLFDPGETADVWAQAIKAVLEKPDIYESMARAAYERYSTVLNWQTAARGFREIVERILR